jgi:probable HAF family extracellular repeat protein
VGQSSTATGQPAFLWHDGAIADLGTFGGSASQAFDINNRGQVVGLVDDSYGGSSGAFVSSDGAMTHLGKLGGTTSLAYAVNDLGQVVGWASIDAEPSDEARAYLWEDGATTDLGALGGAWTQAYAINECGQVAGSSGAAPNDNHAVLWAAGMK